MNLRDKVFSGFVWLFISSLAVQGISFFSSVALARLLTPNDFGLVAIATIFISLSAMLSEFGFGQAIIQWQGEIEEAASIGFLLNMLISLVLAVALFAAAPLIGAFYDSPEVTAVVSVLTVSLLLSSLGIVPGNLLERDLEFRRKLAGEVAPALVYGLVAITLAWRGAGVWSLVVGLVASAGVRSILFWRQSGFRPHARYEPEVGRRLLRFGSHLLAISVLLFLINKLDVFYLGRVADPTQVGYYGLAMTIVTLSVDMIASLFGRVTFPAFSKLQNDLPAVARAYMRSMNYIAYAAFPVICGVFATAPIAIDLIYGPKWTSAAALTRILCLYALLRTLSRLTGSVFTATGRPDISTRLAVVRLVLLVAALIPLGKSRGTEGVAWAVSLSMAFAGLWSIWLTNRYLAIPHYRLTVQLAPQALAGVLMAIIVNSVRTLLPETAGVLLLLVLIGVVSYGLLLWVFGHRTVLADLRDIWSLVRAGLPSSPPLNT